MRSSSKFLIGAGLVGAALIAAPVAAQSAGAFVAQARVPHLTTIGAPARSKGENAWRYMEEGRYKDALRVYRRIVAEQRAAGEYPLDALKGVVAAEFALGDERATARALDELSDAANRFGDPDTQVRSLFEAALLYQRTSNRHHVENNLAAIRALLKSPAISEATRKEIATRIPRR